jgi:hypothetical protein
MTEFGPHQVRNGRHVLRFQGRVLGSASSAREDASRWSELAVYGLTNGSYIRSKVGRSVVVHAGDCPLVDRFMTRWVDLDDGDEAAVRRVPCVVCQPVLDALDPLRVIESTRYTATVAADAAHLVQLLTAQRPAGQLPRLVSRVVEQCCAADPVFARGYQRYCGVKVTG